MLVMGIWTSSQTFNLADRGWLQVATYHTILFAGVEAGYADFASSHKIWILLTACTYLRLALDAAGYWLGVVGGMQSPLLRDNCVDLQPFAVDAPFRF